MSIEERREEEKEQRRRTIVDAAETVLREKDRDDMTMADIAEEARLSRSLLYVYFEDMEDILLGVTLRGLRWSRKQYEDAIADNDIGVLQLRGIGDAYIRFSQEKPVYFDLVAEFELRPDKDAEADDAPKRLKQCLAEDERRFELMIHAIQNGIDDGSIRGDLDPVETAITLWGFTHGLIRLLAKKGEEIEEEASLRPETIFENSQDFLGVALYGSDDFSDLSDT